MQKFLVAHFWAFHDVFLLEEILKSSRAKVQHTYQLHPILILHLSQYLLYLLLIKPIIDDPYRELGLVYHLVLRPFVEVILRDEVQFLKDGVAEFEDFGVGVGRLSDVLFIDAQRVMFVVEEIG